MRIFWLVMALFSLSSCAINDSNNNWHVNTQALDGTWQLEIIDGKQNNSSIENVDVPNNWHSVGIEHAGVAYYRRTFDMSAINKEARYWIDFNAVDYFTEVSLNNKLVGSHEGYFSPFKVEVTNDVVAGSNQLTVQVDSPNEEIIKDWSLNKTLIKGVLNHHDTRPGGAWSDQGQDYNSGGIWGSVALRQTGPIAIDNIKVVPIVLDVEQALTTGTVKIELDSAYQGSAIIEIELSPLASPNATPQRYEIDQYVHKERQNISWQLPIEKRELWWPWDWGNPTQYTLGVSVKIPKKQNDKTDSLSASSLETSDSKLTNIGFRQVRYDQDAGGFYVNNQPYFIRGTNYIGSQWLGEMTEQDYRNDLDLMQQANINSIRVHAHVAGQALYKVADELGFIIWQDFPLQWGYNDSPEFIEQATIQAKAMTDMLYNHSSIAFWCGQNEPPWDADWMKYKYETYTPSKNVQLTESVYKQLLLANDKRVVRKASYTKEHPWLGWYSGSYKDYKNKPTTPIVSEFGAQAMPDYLTMRSLLEDEYHWPLTEKAIETLSYHNYQPHETLNIAKVTEGESLSHFVKNSQEYQRLVTKYATEHLRLYKGAELAAIYQFMFVDSWPAITWSVLDNERRMKPGYFALQQAYQPVLIMASVNKVPILPTITVTVINDTLEEYRNTSLVVKNIYDDRRWIIDDIDIKSNAQSSIITAAELIGLSEYFTLTLIDQSGNEISENSYLSQDLK